MPDEQGSNRRAADNCIAKRLYEQATPYIQIFGWIAVTIPVLYVAFSFISDVQAYGPAIQDLQLFRAHTETRLARMEQEEHDTHENVRDLHDYLLPSKHHP